MKKQVITFSSDRPDAIANEINKSTELLAKSSYSLDTTKFFLNDIEGEKSFTVFLVYVKQD